ncbi:peptidylprolyl isomerase [Polaribacter butkevichii]|uniref:Peptidylprolyl isomerase n=1 Tax=Polaribacter butkevichii TaxID=218490 RepID=A0A2P6CF91_9FLAO|nr:peptidylprolyl isomerase [Polaribacter butkevichii]PQJ73579.1 peptidylprolyl isomerase [Polaribacter butkevichii]
MKKIVLLFVLSLSIAAFAQKKDKTLLTIDGEKTTVSEFKRVYEKNLDAIDNEEAKSINKNLDLYINYKLKVKEAYAIKLDTLPSYKREMETYKNQLSAPYLQDTTFIDQLVKDAYFRTKYQVKAKHILMRLPREASPSDTLVVYNKILKLRERILNGEKFETLAAQYSEDRSAKDDPETGRKGNGGNLGYFSGFSMVYPFEVAAYTTKVGEISMPFKTQFGYHIVQVDDVKESKGEIEAAHILLRDTTLVGKAKIDSIYTKLKNNEKFEDLAKQYSEDPGSKNNGGSLGKFASGRMVKPFDDAAFGLENVNDYSKPFKTRFGWHIVKLTKKHPIKSFDEMKKDLKSKVKTSSRMELSEKAVVNKLKKEYTITEFEDAKKILDKKNLRGLPKDSLQGTLLAINDKNITQEDFIKYIRNRRQFPVYKLFEMFKEKQILEYYKEDLVNREPEYAYTLKEYEDGLLLFELMQEKIWNQSSKDTLGLQEYFKINTANYKTTDLKSIKGQVINDYQNFLEKNWIADLRKKSKIKVDKKQLKKLIKFYENK